jgi:hypothetical protein
VTFSTSPKHQRHATDPCQAMWPAIGSLDVSASARDDPVRDRMFDRDDAWQTEPVPCGTCLKDFGEISPGFCLLDAILQLAEVVCEATKLLIADRQMTGFGIDRCAAKLSVATLGMINQCVDSLGCQLIRLFGSRAASLCFTTA